MAAPGTSMLPVLMVAVVACLGRAGASPYISHSPYSSNNPYSSNSPYSSNNPYSSSNPYSPYNPHSPSLHPDAQAVQAVQLWFLTPMEVAEQISRIPLSDYREVQPDAPVAAKNSPMDHQSLRQEMVDVSQFHTQDGTGRAVFGYSTGDQVRIEARSSAGRVRGSYSYRDPTGKIVQVQYWDDGDGFHVSGNSLPSQSDVPEPVTETPEVSAARLQHEALHAQALQAALLAGSGSAEPPAGEEQTDSTRVEEHYAPPSSSAGSDLPPVYDEDGTELRRYPAVQHASLYDPSHLHDAEREAVIISNPELEPVNTFNDIQLFRTAVTADRRQQQRGQMRGRRQNQEQGFPAAPSQPQERNGFFYSLQHPAPLLVASSHPAASYRTAQFLEQPQARPLAQPQARPLAQPQARPLAQPQERPLAQPVHDAQQPRRPALFAPAPPGREHTLRYSWHTTN